MAHRLWPRDGAPFLSPEDIVSRLRTAFASVHVDRRRASEEVEAGLAYLRRVAGPGQPLSRADVDRKERHRSRAVYVTIEEGGVTIATLIEVDDGLLFSYSGAADERRATPLVERVAAVLGYDCEAV